MRLRILRPAAFVRRGLSPLLRSARSFSCSLCGVKEPQGRGERLRDLWPDEGREERTAMGEARAFRAMEDGERRRSASGGKVHGTGVVQHSQRSPAQERREMRQIGGRSEEGGGRKSEVSGQISEGAS